MMIMGELALLRTLMYPSPRRISAIAFFIFDIEDANSKIREKGIKEGYNDMCTTLVMAVILDNRAYFVNAGDNRAYLLRQGKLSKITRDNSYVARLLEEGAITEEEAETHPKKNKITKALGAEPILDPDFYKIFIEEGDYILLCSNRL